LLPNGLSQNTALIPSSCDSWDVVAENFAQHLIDHRDIRFPVPVAAVHPT
jgi:hypothetical protein